MKKILKRILSVLLFYLILIVVGCSAATSIIPIMFIAVTHNPLYVLLYIVVIPLIYGAYRFYKNVMGTVIKLWKHKTRGGNPL